MSQITGRRIKLGQMTITSRLYQAQNLVRAFEVFHASAIAQADGGFVVGYGHTASAREGAMVSRAEAEALLLYDLGQIGTLLDAWVYAPMNANQRQALIAFGFDIGVENLHKSTAMRRLNAGDYMGCAREIERWRMADLAGRGQVVDALVRRRAAEKALFLTPPEGFLKPDTTRLRPRFDGQRYDPAPAVAESAGEPTSAAMAAAHNVSARLRALLPDTDPAPLQPSREPAASDVAPPEGDQPELDLAPPVEASSEAGGAVPHTTAAVPNRDTPSEMAMATDPQLEAPQDEGRMAEPTSTQVPTAALQLPVEPLMHDPVIEGHLAPPPPFIPAPRSYVAPPGFANDFDPGGLGDDHEDTVWSRPYESTPAPVEPTVKRPMQGSKQTLRERLTALFIAALSRAHLFLGLFGALLFVLSIVSILTGRPSAMNLGLGLLGVLCMTPTAYVFLGAPRR